MNPKVVIGFGILGFMLSFLIGLISGNSIGVVFLRAIISAVAFVGVAFGGRFLFSKFLGVQSTEITEKQDASELTDVTVEDESLPEDDGPSFYVDISSNVQAEAAKKAEFNTSVKKDIATENISTENHTVLKNEPVQETKVQQTDVEQQKKVEQQLNDEQTVISSIDDGLDELPEINDYVGEGTSAGMVVPEGISESFKEASFIPTGLEEITSFQDSALTAQAIRTLMANE